jgi:hypothetical protein
MYVPEIIEVKDSLQNLQNNGFLKQWELPYENLLTRRNAAIFFLTPANESALDDIFSVLAKYPNFSYRVNEERKLSNLAYRVTFSAEEKEKNEASSMVAATA